MDKLACGVQREGELETLSLNKMEDENQHSGLPLTNVHPVAYAISHSHKYICMHTYTCIQIQTYTH